ncbi:MAG: hypothetical protein US49_C0006G0101 [candidate division TM6 bacterium GW2011_GWF2_37_49]|nr:MAG: hypothetical protein US49_C0006G0101 [candidate division TM6 bacterium GW2011_GWF2_37_49]
MGNIVINAKKILLIGHFSDSPHVYTYATSFLKVLLKLGHDVKTFDYRRKAPFLLDYSLKRLSKKFNPDLIFFVKAEKISWHTVRFLKNNSPAILVNFYPDNPFVFWNSNSNSDVLHSLPFIDYFLIWSEQLAPIIHSAGAKKVIYFPFAFDGDMFIGASKNTDTDINLHQSDVCFVGSWDTSRQRCLEKLLEKMPDLKLAVWGNRWKENLSASSGLLKFIKGDAVYGADMINVFKSSKIALNFIRKQNLNAHNMRTFEIPASKAFMLTQYTDEQAKHLFQDGESVECFKNIEELVFKIKFFLKNEALRNDRAEKGFLVAQKYVLEKQMSDFLKKIGI